MLHKTPRTPPPPVALYIRGFGSSPGDCEGFHSQITLVDSVSISLRSNRQRPAAIDMTTTALRCAPNRLRVRAPSPAAEQRRPTKSAEVTRSVTSPSGGAVTSRRASGGVQEKLLCPACRASQDACSACQEHRWVGPGGAWLYRWVGSKRGVGWGDLQTVRI